MTIRSAFAPTSIAATVLALLDSSCFSAGSMPGEFLLDGSGMAVLYREIEIRYTARFVTAHGRRAVARRPKRGSRFQQVHQLLPNALLAKPLPEGHQLGEHLVAAGFAVLAKVIQPGPQTIEPPRVSEKTVNLRRFGTRKGGEVFGPDVAIVDLAQQRLQLLDRLEDGIHFRRMPRPDELQRVAQPLGGDPHGVVPVAALRIGQPPCLAEELLEPLAYALYGAAAARGARRCLRLACRIEHAAPAACISFNGP